MSAKPFLGNTPPLDIEPTYVQFHGTGGIWREFHHNPAIECECHLSRWWVVSQLVLCIFGGRPRPSLLFFCSSVNRKDMVLGISLDSFWLPPEPLDATYLMEDGEDEPKLFKFNCSSVVIEKRRPSLQVKRRSDNLPKLSQNPICILFCGRQKPNPAPVQNERM